MRLKNSAPSHPSPEISRHSAPARCGLLSDVPELDHARTHRRQQAVALPADVSIADEAADVVVDSEALVDHEKR